MSLALATSSGIRLAGRSFLAFVLEPHPPVATWLADLDAMARRSLAFFANRPVVLDLARLAPDRTETDAIVAALRGRHIRVIAVEGVDPAWLGPAIAPIGSGKHSAKVVEFPGNSHPPQQDRRSTASKAPLIVDQPVRSGQSIVHPEGDVTVLGSISSGAEVIAGGSIHAYGTLRGRALAGAAGNPNAVIFAHKFQAELVAIGGNYLTAEQSSPSVVDRSVLFQLKGDVIVTECLD
ncbi:MAG: septum formation inhibitor MinC [Hyphomicrobiales bacterium]|nr:septum formation inhibitor MinC [Hyphomicrobiales bacterium]